MFLANKYGLRTVTREEFKVLYESNNLGDLIFEVKQRFLPEFLSLYQTFKGDNEKPFEGVKEALRKLKDNKYILAVVTGRIIEPALVRRELKQHGLATLFNDILTNFPVDNPYDDSGILQKVTAIEKLLNKYNLPPDQCVVVGDYVADISSGKKLGCWTIAVLSGGMDYRILERTQPDAILKSVSEIPSLLKIA